MLLLDFFISNTCKCWALSLCWAFGISVELLDCFPGWTQSLRELRGGGNGENPILFSALTFYSLLVYKHAGAGGGWGQRGERKQRRKDIHSLLTFNLSCSKHNWKLCWIFLPLITGHGFADQPEIKLKDSGGYLFWNKVSLDGNPTSCF